MQELHLKMLVVLGAGLARFFFGWFWFNPGIFGKAWIKTLKVKESEMKKGMAVGMATYLISSVLMASLLVYAIKFGQMAHCLPEGLAGGLMGGFVYWLGFVATVLSESLISEKKPFKWFLITGGFNLAGMLIMGSILAVYA
jgi:hypothetical protein